LEVAAFYQAKASSVKQTDYRDVFRRPPTVSVYQTQWYLLTPCLQFLQLWRLTKHRRWPWTGRQRRYKNGGLLWLLVHSKYRSSNKKLPV